MVRLAIVDDHEIVRDGLTSLLQKHDNIKVVAQYADGEDILAALNEPCCIDLDVVLMDINMKQVNGLQVLERIQKAALPKPPKFLILTFFNDMSLQKQCEYLGAKGCLSKDSEVSEIVHAVNRVMLGETHFTKARNVKNAEIFTEKELSIISCMSQGMTNKEIAEHLFLGLGTVKNYNSAIYAKLNVKQRPQAITRLKEMGLI